MRITVTATCTNDLPGVWTPDRFWPRAKAVEVEVLAQDEDPIDPATGKPDAARIGQRTLARLKRDPRLIVTSAGDDVASGEVYELQAEVHRVGTELEGTRDQLAAALREVDELRELLAAASAPKKPVK